MRLTFGLRTSSLAAARWMGLISSQTKRLGPLENFLESIDGSPFYSLAGLAEMAMRGT